MEPVDIELDYVKDDIKQLFGLEGKVDQGSMSDLYRYLSKICFYKDGTIREVNFIYLDKEE